MAFVPIPIHTIYISHKMRGGWRGGGIVWQVPSTHKVIRVCNREAALLPRHQNRNFFALSLHTYIYAREHVSKTHGCGGIGVGGEEKTMNNKSQKSEA
jgi:hypothetical protein